MYIILYNQQQCIAIIFVLKRHEFLGTYILIKCNFKLVATH